MNRGTSFIAAAAVTGVVLAGTTAVAANVGLLNSVDRDVADASVVTTTPIDVAPVTADPQVIDIYIEDPVVSTVPLVPETVPESLSQAFNVEAAGTVTVAPTATGVLLDGVTVAEGWNWTMVQPSPVKLEVMFSSGDTTYVFYASLAPDGSITARVDQPIVKIVQGAAPSSSTGSSRSAPAATAPARGHYEDDHDDDDDDDHDDHDDHDDEDDEDGDRDD